MRRHLVFSLCPLLLIMLSLSCASLKFFDLSEVTTIEILTNETYLLKSPDTAAIAEKELDAGSVLFLYRRLGPYFEVYTKNPKALKSQFYVDYHRYYIYLPVYKTVDYFNETSARLIVIPSTYGREYFVGPRGGCYYVNSKRNRVYVHQSICSSLVRQTSGSGTTPTTISSTPNSTSQKCPTTQCSGRTKKGERCRNRTTNCSGRCYLH